MIGAVGCPVVHTTLNWVVVALLIALLVTIVVVVATHAIGHRRALRRERMLRPLSPSREPERARLPGRMW